MSLNIQSFSELTQSQVDQAYNQVVQMVQEQDPTIDVKRGVIHDLVIYLSSILSASNQANIDKVRRSNSLMAVNADPTIADDDVIDRLASNYRITRDQGSQASGSVVIVLNALKVVKIPAGSVFTTSTGLEFTSDQTYISRTSSETVTASTDRLLVSLGSGNYSFTINVTASAIGSASKLSRNTALVPPQTDTSIVRSYTGSDFAGGRDVETNEELNDRLQSGIVYKSLANRGCIDGLIRSLELSVYDSNLTNSVIGYGDAEMIRYHSILPVAFGGRVDVYSRTQSYPATTQLTKTATYTGTNGSGQGVWQIVLGRDDVPAMYEVTRITLPGSIDNLATSSFQTTSDIRAYDLSTGSTASTTYFPDLTSATEAVYTRYQTATIKFVDSITSVSGLTIDVSTKDYSLIASYMPGITSIQDAVSDRSTRSPVSDCLIKAPMPCFLSLTLDISKTSSDTSPTTTTLQQAAADAVNSLGFAGKVALSIVVSAVQKVLTGSVTITSAVLQGRVRKPDGTITNLSSTTVLDVSSLAPTSMLSSKTIGLFLNPEDVTINITTVS